MNQATNVQNWTKEAKKRKSKGFVDMCDTFDFDHYPIYFGGPKDEYKTASEVIAAKDGKNMQKQYGTYTV